MNKADLLSEYLRDKRNEFSKVPSTLSLLDATLNQLVVAYNSAQIERQQLLDANIPGKNPAVVQAEGQIEKLRINILESIKNIKESISSVINETRRKSQESQSQLQRMPGKVKEQKQIEQHAESLQSLYKYLQEKKEETAITRASTISNSNIIDKAFPTSSPVKPNRKAIQILAILLGLGPKYSKKNDFALKIRSPNFSLKLYTQKTV